MTTAQVTLSDEESQAIQALSESQGKTPEEILHAAIELFLVQNQAANRLTSLQQARGIWQDREDLPDLARLRSEWDRQSE